MHKNSFQKSNLVAKGDAFKLTGVYVFNLVRLATQCKESKFIFFHSPNTLAMMYGLHTFQRSASYPGILTHENSHR